MKTQGTKNDTKSGYFKLFFILTLFSLTFTFNHQVSGQTTYHVADGSKIIVAGTSTLHDWTMQADKFNVDAAATVKADQIVSLSALTFSLPVVNLKSKEKSMDTRAYKALKSDEFKDITFKLTNAVVVPEQKVIKATGILTISGVSKTISFPVEYHVTNGIVSLKGSKGIKMSEYGIKVPSFMLGAMKTGDDLKINISLNLKN